MGQRITRMTRNKYVKSVPSVDQNVVHRNGIGLKTNVPKPYDLGTLGCRPTRRASGGYIAFFFFAATVFTGVSRVPFIRVTTELSTLYSLRT